MEATNTPLRKKYLSVDRKLLVKRILRFLFSHFGLCILNILYLCLGSLIFIQLEAYQDAEADDTTRRQIFASKRIDQQRRELINLIVTHAAYTNESTIERWINSYHELIVHERQQNQYRISITEADFSPSTRWAFSSVMLFVLSLVATIGYGHIYPKSEGGYLAVTIYGVFGFPFFIMSLASIGSGLASALNVVYYKACCFGLTKRRVRTHGSNPTTSFTQEPSGVNYRTSYGVPLSLAFSMVVLYIILGSLLFSWKENWDYMPSIYFCVVTLMTIGFGDLVPGWSATSNETGKLSIAVAFLYIIIGLALVSMALKVAVNSLRRRVTIMISKMKIWQDKEIPSYLR